MSTIGVVVAIWLLFGVIAAGFNFAYFQRKFPSLRHQDFVSDQGYAVTALAFGPIALGVGLWMLGTNSGWLWPWSKKAKREAGIA